jgi:hypothetical protein
MVRMIAASCATTFGSLWLALYVSGLVAPPEPEIATLGRRICLVLFIVTFIWSMVLYASYHKEQKELNRTGAEAQRRNG